MSVLCDLALAAGLTLGGFCTEDALAVPDRSLPNDEAAAWALPPAAPAPDAPPTMPAIVVETADHAGEIGALRDELAALRAALAASDESEPPAPVAIIRAAPPPPDPVVSGLAVQWSRPSVLPAGWASPAYQATTGEDDTDVAVFTADGPPILPASVEPLLPPRYESEGRESSRPVDNTRIFAADRYITGIIETSINGQVGGRESGSIIIQSARDVYGYHGRKVLVPKGSRLICSYQPPEDMGSSRLLLNCERILLAGHRAEIVNLDTLVSDAQGRAGTTGEVDRRFLERYGTAFLLTGLSTAVRYGAASHASGEEDETAAEAAAEELSTRFGEITASVLEETLSLVPIITIPQGTRVQIRPRTDWYIAPWKSS